MLTFTQWMSPTPTWLPECQRYLDTMLSDDVDHQSEQGLRSCSNSYLYSFDWGPVDEVPGTTKYGHHEDVDDGPEWIQLALFFSCSGLLLFSEVLFFKVMLQQIKTLVNFKPYIFRENKFIHFRRIFVLKIDKYDAWAQINRIQWHCNISNEENCGWPISSMDTSIKFVHIGHKFKGPKEPIG